MERAWLRVNSSPLHRGRSVPCTAIVGALAISPATQAARSCSSAIGQISETRPIWWAREADMRSEFPSKVMRTISPKGILGSMCSGSYPAGMPKVTWGSKKVAWSAAMMMSASPSM